MRPIVTSIALLLMGSCGRAQPITIGVVFDTGWTLRGELLPEADRVAVKATTLDTLQRSFDGFAIHFTDGPAGDRTIRVEDTPYVEDPRELTTFGAAGLTYPAARVSHVRIDVLFDEELAVVHCSAVLGCATPRFELMRALGRGIGATAAHEVGHQIGFAADSGCEDCYDGRSADSYVHFFGEKHWSDRAIQRMIRVLPPA